jgi:Family of unknown function (DUF5906)
MDFKVCSALGAYETHKDDGKDYDAVSWDTIKAMAAEPPSVEKDRSRWVIPSAYHAFDARVHAAQRQRGEFWLLCLDVDKGSPTLDEVADAVEAALGGVYEAILYASRSCTPEVGKWRVMIPLTAPVAGWAWKRVASHFYDRIEGCGVTPDRSLARPGQVIYLPNAGDFYDWMEFEGPRFDPHAAGWVPDEAERDEVAVRDVPAPEPQDGVIGAFNAAHSIESLLQKYGYAYAGDRSSNWRSPMQESASFATRDFGTHWVSLSESDAEAGIGRQAADSDARFGDAFDLFVHFEHGGDWDNAIKAAGREASVDRVSRLAERLERVAPGSAATNERIAGAAQEAIDEREDAADDWRQSLVVYAPSISARDARWMVLHRQATLTGSVADLWSCYGVNNVARLGNEFAQNLLRADNVQRTDRMPVLDPRMPFGFMPDEDGSGLGVVNRYQHREVLPQALEEAQRGTRHPALAAWAELLDRVFIVPRERVWAEQWLAFKARFPWERMVALVNTTDQTGTGRGTLTNKVREMFGETNTSPIRLSNFVGEGARFNAYLTSTMAIMDELNAETEAIGRQSPAKVGMAIYEKLKECVDPNPKWVEINAKYGKLGWQWSFTSFFLCTNHENALPIPEKDRRFCVTSGNGEQMPDEVYQRLIKALGAEGATDVIWAHLVHLVDVAGFNPAKPLDTDAKRAMIDSNVSDLDFEIEGEMKALGWPIYMTMDLLRAIALNTDEGKARAHDKSLEPALKNWMTTHSFTLPAATAGNGARLVKVRGKPVRVRVCRLSLKALGRDADAVTTATGIEVAQALASVDVAVIRRKNGQSALHVVEGGEE